MYLGGGLVREICVSRARRISDSIDKAKTAARRSSSVSGFGAGPMAVLKSSRLKDRKGKRREGY